MSAILQHGADLGESHACAWELPFVPEITGGDPDCGESAVVQQSGQSVGIELVGLMDVGHHFLGEVGVCEQRDAAGSFDLVDDPVPVADSFQSDGSVFRELGEEGLNSAGIVIDANTFHDLAVWTTHGE